MAALTDDGDERATPLARSRDRTEKPFRVGWLQRGFLAGVSPLLSTYFRVEMHGLERLPRDRPLIFVAKHPRTWLHAETLLFRARAFVRGGLVPFRLLERPDLERHGSGLVGWIHRGMGAIPASEEAALAALRRGESLLIFPGGARELHGPVDSIQWRGRRRYARLAVLTRTPVVPLAIHGADRQHLLRLRMGQGRTLWLPVLPLPVKLTFEFGPPMAPPADAGPHSVAAFSDAVAHEARRLLAFPRRR